MSDLAMALLSGCVTVVVCLAASVVVVVVVPRWRERRRQRQNRVHEWQAMAHERVRLVSRDGLWHKEVDRPGAGVASTSNPDLRTGRI